MSNVFNIGTSKDFEIIWIDRFTRLPKDLNDVTIEIYHYEDGFRPKIISTFPEPYIVTEAVNDSLEMTSILSPSGYVINSSFQLQLDQYDEVDCPANDFVVCESGQKVSISNGFVKYALSACELSSIINLDASGYTAGNEEGFVTLQGLDSGENASLIVGSGTLNSVLGLNSGDTAEGSELKFVFDLNPSNMIKVSTGRYVYTNVDLSEPLYKEEERYYVIYRGIDPITLKEEMYQEDFVLIRNASKKSNLVYYYI